MNALSRLFAFVRCVALLGVLVGVANPALAAKTYSENGDGTVTDPTIELDWLRHSNRLNWLESHFSFRNWSLVITKMLVSIFLSINVNIVSAATWNYSGNLQKTHRNHTATLLTNGKVLIVAGSFEVSAINGSYTAELYDPATETSALAGTLVASQPSPHTATLLSNGKVLATGADYSVGSAQLYNPITNTWAAASALSTARNEHTATLLPNGKVLVVGGSWYDGTVGGTLASAELYDPVANTWTVVRSLGTARYGHTATLLSSGKVLVVGGVNTTYLNSAELYDPSTNTWTATIAPASSRYMHTATLLPNGKVLVAGGYGSNLNNGTSGFLSSAELYDPSTNDWTVTGALATTHSGTATLLSDGKVLVADGSAELYDPVTGTWSATSALNTRRGEHTATLLPNSKVLVAGGCCNSYATLSSTEIYDPNGTAIAPSAPINPIAVGGRSNATVTFAAPASNGGSGLIGYLVTSIPAGGTDSNGGTTGLSHVVTGLTNGTSYSFTVTAGNAAGNSAPSSVSNSVTPAVSPGVPTNPIAVPGDREALITFEAPINNGGSPITGYHVASNPPDGFDATPGTALTHTVKNLINGRSYVFVVSASNTAGSSFGSSWSNSVTPGMIQSISFGAAPMLVVGGTGTVTATGGASGNAVTFSSNTPAVCTVSGINGSTVTALAAGNCVIVANQASNANYIAAPQATQTIAVSAGTQTLSFVQGWNLVGNGTDAPILMSASFSDVNQFVTVWKWIAAQSAWSFYAPALAAQGGTVLAGYAASKGYQVLNSVAGGEGFWVNAKQPASVSVAQGQNISVANVGATLLKGWNLVSVGESTTPQPFCDAQSSGVTTLWAWDNPQGKWYFYAPNLEGQGGTALFDYTVSKGYLDFTANRKALGPGVGFWVNRP